MLFVLTSNLTLFRQSYNVIFPSLTKIMHNASFFYIFFCTFVRFLSTFWLSFLFQYGYVNHIEVAYEKTTIRKLKKIQNRIDIQELKVSFAIMGNRSIVSIADYGKEKIQYLLDMATEFEAHPNRQLLKGKVVATLFFEPSTRTRLSFETAANRLGARVIGFTDPKATSSSKGETLKDTIKMVSNYADVIVMRHSLEGAALYASEVTDVPIINAGDGSNLHPSQTMLDLYSIYKTQRILIFVWLVI